MKRNKLKFAGGSAVVILTVVYLALANGGGDNLVRTVSIADLKNPSDARYKQRMTLVGVVKPCSIEKEGRVVRFVVRDKTDKSLVFPVEYRGKDPLPDIFGDKADVDVDGRLDRSGLFVGDRVAAKCASKYPAKGAVQEVDPEIAECSAAKAGGMAMKGN